MSEWLGERRLHAWQHVRAAPRCPRASSKSGATRTSRSSSSTRSPSRAASALRDELPDAGRSARHARSAAKRPGTCCSWTAHRRSRTWTTTLRAQGRDRSSDLATRLREHARLVAAAPGDEARSPRTNGKFAALNAALWSGGVLRLRAARRTHRAADPGRSLDHEARHGRSSAHADRRRDGSHVGVRRGVLLARTSRCRRSRAARSRCSRATARRCSTSRCSSWGKGVRHIATQRTIAGRDAKLDTLVVNLGASVARVDLAASLEGPGARSDMLGLYFARRRPALRPQHAAGPHGRRTRRATCCTRARCTTARARCSAGSSRCIPKAQRTDAYQTNRNLLLSEHARGDVAAQPRDRGRRRALLARRDGRPARRGRAVLHHDARRLARVKRSGWSCSAFSARCWTGCRCRMSSRSCGPRSRSALADGGW